MGNTCPRATYIGRENEHAISITASLFEPPKEWVASHELLKAHAGTDQCGGGRGGIVRVSWYRLHDSPQLEDAELRLSTNASLDAPIDVLVYDGDCAALNLLGCGSSAALGVAIPSRSYANKSLLVALVARVSTRLDVGTASLDGGTLSDSGSRASGATPGRDDSLAGSTQGKVTASTSSHGVATTSNPECEGSLECGAADGPNQDRVRLRADYTYLPAAEALSSGARCSGSSHTWPPLSASDAAARDAALQSQLAQLRSAAHEDAVVNGGVAMAAAVLTAALLRRLTPSSKSASCSGHRSAGGRLESRLCARRSVLPWTAAVLAVLTLPLMLAGMGAVGLFFRREWTESVVEWHNAWLRSLQAGQNWEPITDVPLPWAEAMRAGTRAISAEFDDYTVRRGQPTPRLRALDAERASFSKRAVWPTVVLRWYGADSDVVADFPATIALLRQLPSVSHAFFSVLKPGDRLEPHIGTSSAVLRCLPA